MKKKILLCSECFKDYGLRLIAEKKGVKDSLECPCCHTFKGSKLDYEHLYDLAWDYFVRGSYYATTFGGSPCFGVNEYSSFYDNCLADYKFSDNLRYDIALFYRHKITIFPYGPRMFRIGLTEWFNKLIDTGCNPDYRNNRHKNKIIKAVVERCYHYTLKENKPIYRVRKDPPSMYYQDFDAPPTGSQKIKDGRLNIKENSVFYAAFSPSTCIYENKIEIRQPYVMARLYATRPLNLIDLTRVKDMKKEYDEFSNLKYSLKLISGAEGEAYHITHMIAEYVYKKGYDGIIYSSFYDIVRDFTLHKNIALFGHPIQEGKLKIDSLNKLQLQQIQYKYTLGPVFDVKI